MKKKGEEEKYFISSPELLTHPIFSNYLNHGTKKIRFGLPDTFKQILSDDKDNQTFYPLLRDGSYMKKLLDMQDKITWIELPQDKIGDYDIIRNNLRQRISFLKGSSLYKTCDYIFELLCYSYLNNYPLLLAKSSESPIKSIIKRINEFLYIYHTPALIRLIDGEEEFPDRLKKYGDEKLEAAKLIFTKEGRGLLSWAGTFLVVSHVFLETLTFGAHAAIEAGWIVFYDP
jgi:hypothetical protein